MRVENCAVALFSQNAQPMDEKDGGWSLPPGAFTAVGLKLSGKRGARESDDDD